jgi:hypothetical protein
MKATDVARKALMACLVISADSTDIHSTLDVKGAIAPRLMQASRHRGIKASREFLMKNTACAFEWPMNALFAGWNAA